MIQVDVWKNVLHILDSYLEMNNHRKTPERYTILKAIYNIEGHFSLEELSEKLVHDYNFPVSRATLYNTLNLFLELRLVIRHRFQGATKYEACYDNSSHSHQICTVCGKVTEVESEEIVKAIDRLKINILFTIGGDGTQRGAHEIAEKCLQYHIRCNVVGIPKTIDNDLNFMDRTFGFETAVQAASNILSCAHNEAKGAYNGIGLVRVMGRDSGFIAAYSALANSLVNFCLIPEVPFELEGPGGLLEAMEKRMEKKHHAVIVVAEGAGQHLLAGEKQRDKSGNILHNDIGAFLKARLKQHFEAKGLELNVKYFDPSYEIRSLPANSTDSIFCLLLAQHAVHAAMAGMTDLVVGNWNGYYTYVPIPMATSARRAVDPHGQLWQSVLLTTRQALLMDSQRVK